MGAGRDTEVELVCEYITGLMLGVLPYSVSKLNRWPLFGLGMGFAVWLKTIVWGMAKLVFWATTGLALGRATELELV